MSKRKHRKRAAWWAALSFILLAYSLGQELYSSSSFFLQAEPLETKLEKLKLVTAQGVQELGVEIARTPQEQATGLMFRRQLAIHQGMLFIHEKPKEVSMWMRNTYISLDMVFIKAEGTVHRIEEKTEPLSEEVISSHGPVIAVLEISSGSAQRYGLKPGDKIISSFFKNLK